jgi:hypothetical protein
MDDSLLIKLVINDDIYQHIKDFNELKKNASA